MISRFLFGALALLVAFDVSAQADELIVRGRDGVLKGTVKSEDAKTVVVSVAVGKKKGDEIVPSVDIVDIVYESVSPGSLSLKGAPYRIAKDAEKDANTDDPSKRNASLALAIKNYNETLKKMSRDTTAQKYAARHLEFKVAVLEIRQAADLIGTDRLTAMDRAITKLLNFKDNYKSSWQINQVMPMIAQIQMDSKDWDKAAATFQEMADMPVFTDDVRREAELMVVTVAVRAKDIPLANKRLDQLTKKAGKDLVFLARVNMARAEVLVGEGKFDKALPLLQGVVKQTTDKHTKALAHNTLGECLFKADRFDEAKWEFLWVDTVFNHDRNQHAKALYFLWKTFQKLNDETRAQECREMLLGDRQFTGTEFQRLAISQTK